MQAALRHEGEQAHRLEGDRLATGVGAGDDERGKILPEPQIAGHHLVRINKGMTAAHDLEVPARVHLGQAGAHLPCQKPLGEGKVQMRQQLDIGEDAVRMRGDLIGQGL